MRFFVVYLKNCDQKWRWQLYRPAVFFKNTCFPGHISEAMTIKILKAMGNVTVINFQSLTLAIIFTCSVVYLDLSETSMMGLFCENI